VGAGIVPGHIVANVPLDAQQIAGMRRATVVLTVTRVEPDKVDMVENILWRARAVAVTHPSSSGA
jgi:hypothetical protein